MISSIIIDDEQNSVDVLEKLINRFFKDQVEVVSEFNNLNDAVQYLNVNSVDLVFLDMKLDFERYLEFLYPLKTQSSGVQEMKV